MENSEDVNPACKLLQIIFPLWQWVPRRKFVLNIIFKFSNLKLNGNVKTVNYTIEKFMKISNKMGR